MYVGGPWYSTDPVLSQLLQVILLNRCNTNHTVKFQKRRRRSDKKQHIIRIKAATYESILIIQNLANDALLYTGVKKDTRLKYNKWILRVARLVDTLRH